MVPGWQKGSFSCLGTIDRTKQQHRCSPGVAKPLLHAKRACIFHGLVVRTVGCQALDPGSNPAVTSSRLE